MNKSIQNRISRRSFKKENLSQEDKTNIIERINQINQKSNLTIEFLEDGSKAFSSFKKSYGIFHHVRSLIMMKGNKKEEHVKEKIGYYGEELILAMVEMGLGTCWVGGTYDKEVLPVKEEEELICVIVVGKIEDTIKDAFVRNVISKNRKKIEERIVADKEIPSWIKKGLEAVRLAPSAKNSQKVMFYYQKDTLCAKVPEEDFFALVDLGIAKKHFELEAKGKFELGNGGVFQKQ